MARTTTLGSIRSQAQQRADMVNSSFCSTAEINSYINASLAELWGLMAQKYGDDYMVTTSSNFTTIANQTSYPLPSDFFKLLRADIQIDPTPRWMTMRQYMLDEENLYSGLAVTSWANSGFATVRYRLSGDNINLMPQPIPAGMVFRILYVPCAPTLVNDSDTFDGKSGWEEFIVVDTAIKMKDKEESDVSVLMAQKQGLLARIESEAENRNAAEPQRVIDVTQPYWQGYSGYRY